MANEKPTLPRSGNLKVILLIFAFLIVGGTLLYTHQIVTALQEKEKEVAHMYARSLEYLASPRTNESDYGFVLDNIVRAIDFPVILTDAHNEPVWPFHQYTKNIRLDSSWSVDRQRDHLRMLIVQMDERNPPIAVTVEDTIILSYIHYGESPLITRLRWLPYVELSLIGLFILIGYISFSYIKRNEQSSIWVGMARETAHQLGTPISSMMGWVELLKHQAGKSAPILETLHDMESDLQRLQKIADRFSKIGSKPDLKEENLVEVIQNVLAYFRRRLPQAGKHVVLTVEPSEAVAARINRELFEWVVENLVKNALDAIEGDEGRIEISVSRRPKSIVVDFRDNGKGIDQKYRKEIFRPGYSTKARGWGLGLSLSKRIIDTYHRGRLYLRESVPGIGTTFRIKLRA